MKWKVQLSRGSMVSTTEAVRERERERAGRGKHQHTADTQINITDTTKTHNSKCNSTISRESSTRQMHNVKPKQAKTALPAALTSFTLKLFPFISSQALSWKHGQVCMQEHWAATCIWNWTHFTDVNLVWESLNKAKFSGGIFQPLTWVTATKSVTYMYKWCTHTTQVSIPRHTFGHQKPMLEIQWEPERNLSFMVKEEGKKSSGGEKQGWLLGQLSQGKNREGSGNGKTWVKGNAVKEPSPKQIKLQVAT